MAGSSGSIESSSVNMENKSKIMKFDEGIGRWSQLPRPLIWMMKDRLNLVDNVRLAAVCKDWNSASASYSPNPRQRLAPFLMHKIDKDSSSTCVFTNISTLKVNLVCVIPEFDGETLLLFSKGGWLLLAKACDVDTQQSVSVVLLHFRTNSTIVMPSLDGGTRGLSASFSSTSNGTPCCVVLTRGGEAELTLYVANVGDEKWMKYEHPTRSRLSVIESVVVVGSKFYCLDRLGELCTFDKSNLEWKEIPKNSNSEEIRFCYMMESEEGVILKVVERKCARSFGYFKLNEKQWCWEKLSESDTMGRIWFLSSTVGPNNHFTIKEDGKVQKVYALRTWCGQSRVGKNMVMGTDIIFSDSITNSMKTYSMEEMGQWVDLGKVDKLPPSCALYTPSTQV